MSNPYLPEDDPDADIFDTPTSGVSHTLDGTICPRCGIVHEVSNPELDLPDAVLDDIAKMMDSMPDEAARHARIVVGSITSGDNSDPTRLRSQLVKSFSDFSTSIRKANTHGPMLRAMAEVMDVMSGGRVTQLWEVYAAENSLILDHMALKSLNILYQTMNTTGAPPGVAQVMASLITKVQGSIEHSAERYRVLGREFDVPIDEAIITGGVYSKELSPMAVAAMPASLSVDVEDAWQSYAEKPKD